MTLRCYVTIFAVIYCVVLFATILIVGGPEARTPQFMMRLWPLPLGSVALALIGTFAPIARFGSVGGSRFFVPTVLHVTVLAALIVALASTFK